MYRGVEAPRICLHNVKVGTLRLTGLSIFLTISIVERHKVDSGDTATVEIAQVDVVRDGATADLRLVCPVLSFVGVVLDKDIAVHADTNSVAQILSILPSGSLKV